MIDFFSEWDFLTASNCAPAKVHPCLLNFLRLWYTSCQLYESKAMNNYLYMEPIPPLTLVVLSIDEETGPYRGLREYYEEALGVQNGQTVLVLGEITNMTGHYAVVHGKTKQVVCAFHGDLFRPAGEDDL